jgi:hypothetical protein
MAYELRPAEQKEGWLFYSMDDEDEQRHGAIGTMRADFGHGGKEFWNTWFDAQRHLKIPAFKAEFQEIIDSLRNDGKLPPFASRANLQAYCDKNTALPLTNNALGFKIQTLNYTYTFRYTPRPGDYDIYARAFDNRWLLPELAGAHDLPEHCYSVLPSSGALIWIIRGKSGYVDCPDSQIGREANRHFADTANKVNGITRAQEAAMLGGSMNGWDTPSAKPWNYDNNGVPMIPHKTKNEPERG